MIQEYREWIGFVVFLAFVYALCSGVTVGGKHYGLVDCNDKQGLVIDIGEPQDAGAPEAGR